LLQWCGLVPRESMVCNINIDGLPGLSHTVRDIATSGAEHSSLERNVEAAATQLGFQISPLPEEARFGRSDHDSFMRQGVPAVWIVGGVQGRDIMRKWLAT